MYIPYLAWMYAYTCVYTLYVVIVNFSERAPVGIGRSTFVNN